MAVGSIHLRSVEENSFKKIITQTSMHNFGCETMKKEMTKDITSNWTTRHALKNYNEYIQNWQTSGLKQMIKN